MSTQKDGSVIILFLHGILIKAKVFQLLHKLLIRQPIFYSSIKIMFTVISSLTSKRFLRFMKKGNIMQVKFLFIGAHIKKDMTESLSILKGMRSCQKGVMGLKV